MLLQIVTIYLAAATVAVVLARKLGFGAVLGYLFAGVLVGPWGLRLITDVESILHFSEIGECFCCSSSAWSFSPLDSGCCAGRFSDSERCRFW